jgi:hypothetical protein
MRDYEDVAILFDQLAAQHEALAAMLTNRDDPKHKESNEAIAEAERAHSDACRRAAAALRSRKYV